MVNPRAGPTWPCPVNSLIRNAGTNAAITSLVAAPDGFYGTGQAFGRTDGNFEGAFKADWNGNRIWIEDCHGDTYWAALDGAALYVAGHAHDCARIGGFPNTVNPQVHHHGLAFTTATDPHPQPGNRRLLQLRRPAGAFAAALVSEVHRGHLHRAEPGHWNVAVGANYVAYAGEFTNVNGKAQQGLVRFPRAAVAPNLDGPRLSAASMGLTGVANIGSIRMSWPGTTTGTTSG